jgi:hypothetical protein
VKQHPFEPIRSFEVEGSRSKEAAGSLRIISAASEETNPNSFAFTV